MKFPIYQPHPAHRICVIGVPGEGKSEWRNQYLSGIHRCILWNPMGDLNIGERISVEGLKHRIPRIVDPQYMMRLTVEPREYEPIAMSDEYDYFCGLVEQIGNCHLANEEIALVANPTRVPGNFNRLMIRGRHMGISLSTYGQRFHQFPLIARGTATEIIAFRQSDPDDVRDFDKRIAPSISPIPLNQLPPHHFIRYTPTTGAVYHAPMLLVEVS